MNVTGWSARLCRLGAHYHAVVSYFLRYGVPSLLLILAFLPGQLTAVPVSTDPRDRAILIKIFNETDGPNWHRSDGWGIGDPCAFPPWHLVICSIDDAFVIQLLFGFNRLDGTLPPEIGGFQALREFTVERNHLQGRIPAEIARLSHLQILDLAANRLVGQVPPELATMHSLAAEGGLDLSYNALYNDDPIVEEFINVKSVGNWKETQTVAPTELLVNRHADGTIVFNWTAIEFTDYSGRYRVAISSQQGGPYEDIVSTPDKLTTSVQVPGLDPEASYYAVLYTETDPHVINQNKVVSLPSEEILIEPVSGFVMNAGLNGAWLNTETLGQGFFLDIFPARGEVFLAWFTYDLELAPPDLLSVVGHPGHRWLTAQGSFQGNSANLTINLTRGGVFDAGNPVENAPVGSMVLRFDDCKSGVITYEFDTLGLSGEISLSRISDSNVELCESLAGMNGETSR